MWSHSSYFSINIELSTEYDAMLSAWTLVPKHTIHSTQSTHDLYQQKAIIPHEAGQQ